MKRAIIFILLLGPTPALSDDREDVGPLLDKLTRELRDSKTPEKRRKAAEAIGRLGRKAELATRDLCAGLCDRHRSVRQACSESLEKVNPEFRDVVLPIVVDENSAQRVAQLKKIKSAGDEYEDALPAVLFRFRIESSIAESARPSATCYAEVGECLATMQAIAAGDKDASDAVLSVASKSNHQMLRGQALGLIPVMDIPDTKRAVAVLMNAVKVDSDANRVIAIQALERLGPDAFVAADLLRKAKGSGNAAVREAADATLAVFDKTKKAIDHQKKEAKKQEAEK